MVKVYLSGPLFDCTDAEGKGWRDRVKELIGGHHVLDPTDWGHVTDPEALTDEDVGGLVRKDIAAVMMCDAVIYNAWKPSWGSPMECWEAKRLGKKIVAIRNGSVPIWLRYVADRVVSSVEEAAEWVKGL